jgi:hypothetical protein
MISDIAWETLRRVIDTVKDYAASISLIRCRKKKITGQVVTIMEDVLREDSHHLSQVDRQKAIKQVNDEIFGFGPINSLINDPTVTEIMVNGPNRFMWSGKENSTLTDVTFRDDGHVCIPSTRSSPRWAAGSMKVHRWSMPAFLTVPGLTQLFRPWQSRDRRSPSVNFPPILTLRKI